MLAHVRRVSINQIMINLVRISNDAAAKVCKGGGSAARSQAIVQISVVAFSNVGPSGVIAEMD